MKRKGHKDAQGAPGAKRGPNNTPEQNAVVLDWLRTKPPPNDDDLETILTNPVFGAGFSKQRLKNLFTNLRKRAAPAADGKDGPARQETPASAAVSAQNQASQEVAQRHPNRLTELNEEVARLKKALADVEKEKFEEACRLQGIIKTTYQENICLRKEVIAYQQAAAVEKDKFDTLKQQLNQINRHLSISELSQLRSPVAALPVAAPPAPVAAPPKEPAGAEEFVFSECYESEDSFLPSPTTTYPTAPSADASGPAAEFPTSSKSNPTWDVVDVSSPWQVLMCSFPVTGLG